MKKEHHHQQQLQKGKKAEVGTTKGNKAQVRDLKPNKDAKGGTSFNYTHPEVTYKP